MRGKAPDPASRVERPITRVGHRAGVAISERSRRFVDPLDGEPVVAERCVLGAQLLYLLFVCGQPKTADAAQRVASEPLHPVERLLAQLPKHYRALRAERSLRSVVGHRPAPQGEASVPPTCAGGDRARLVQANSPSTLRERERAGEPRDTAPDNGHVNRPVQPDTAKRLGRLVEPIGLSHATIVVTLISRAGRPRRPRRRGRRVRAPSRRR
jgi:hypothetical protein